MKKQRRNRPDDPDYIDIFAEDEDNGEPASVGSLFDEDDEPVSATSEKAKKASGGLFSRKKKQNTVDGERAASIPQKKKRGLFSLKKNNTPEDEYSSEDSLDEEDESASHTEKRRTGLFSRREKKPEPEYMSDDEDAVDDGNIGPGDISDEYDEEAEDDFDGEDEEDAPRESNSRSPLFAWRERDEDEEPPGSSQDQQDTEELVPSDKKKKSPFSFGPFSRRNREDATEKTPEPSPAPTERPAHVYTAPGVNKDEDWDIGGDFSDPFSEPEPEAPEEVEETIDAVGTFPEAGTDTSAEEEESFSFDRFGRRKDKNGRSRYGRRKNAKKATTTVVTNETDSRREEEEARIRAQKRDLIRDREIVKRKAERRVRIIRELKQRLTLAGLLGILLLLVLFAAYFAFRITGIDVTGVCTRYSAEEIIEKSGLKRGKHILMQDLSAARDHLNTDPYLSASVKYVFPNKINITVSQRRGVGVVQWGPDSEYLALIDQKGFVLEASLASQGGLPLVKGLVVTRVVAGKKIGDDADEQVQSTLDVLSALDEFGLLSSVNSIDMSETMGISAYTPEGYRIEIGNVSDLATKLDRLKKGWKTIMSTAADQMRKPSVDNVTIYLYAKSGVVVSPHGIGYVDDNQVAQTQIVYATPEPGVIFAQDPGIVFATPEPTPEPEDIIPPFNNEPFTG